MKKVKRLRSTHCLVQNSYGDAVKCSVENIEQTWTTVWELAEGVGVWVEGAKGEKLGQL